MPPLGGWPASPGGHSFLRALGAHAPFTFFPSGSRKRHGALGGTLESGCQYVCQSPPPTCGEGVPGAAVRVAAHPLSTSHPPSSPPTASAAGCLAVSATAWSAGPCPPPQPAWGCLTLLAGGRAVTALGALTHAPTCPPFPESGSRMSRLSTDKPALGQGAGDGTQICRVTLTLVPGWPWLLGAGTAFPVLSFLPLWACPCCSRPWRQPPRVPASPEGGRETECLNATVRGRGRWAGMGRALIPGLGVRGAWPLEKAALTPYRARLSDSQGLLAPWLNLEWPGRGEARPCLSTEAPCPPQTPQPEEQPWGVLAFAQAPPRLPNCTVNVL